MAKYLKISLATLLFLLLNPACDPIKEKKSATAIKQDTMTIVKNPIVILSKAMLKETVLNEQTVIAGKKLDASKNINSGEYKSLSIKMIDSNAGDENNFSYHVVDTLLSGPDVKVLLIGRAYESENIIWITVYNGQHDLLDHKTVYYDNAEGFLSVETVIKNNQLTITTFNEYADKEKKLTEVYHLDKNNKIVRF